MKKKYQILTFTVIILYSLSGLALAQNAKKLNYGVKVGLSSSGFAQSAQVFTHKRIGVTVGGLVNYMVKDWVGVTGEINYLQEGATHINPEYIYPGYLLSETSFPKIYSDVTIHSIEAPVMMNFYPLPGVNRIAPKFGVGMSFNYILGVISRDLITDKEYSFTANQTNNVTSLFNHTNIGINVSGGLNFVTNKHTYLLDVRYKFGLKKISSLSDYNQLQDHEFSNNTLIITLGITI